MQKNEAKVIICFCFSDVSEDNECRADWKSSSVKTCLFETHPKPDPKLVSFKHIQNPTQKDSVYSQ